MIFYQPEILANPLDIFKLWNGGMSFHGGAVGVSLGILYMARKEKLSWLRIHDYVACVVPCLVSSTKSEVNAPRCGRT